MVFWVCAVSGGNFSEVSHDPYKFQTVSYMASRMRSACACTNPYKFHAINNPASRWVPGHDLEGSALALTNPYEAISYLDSSEAKR